MILKRKTRLFFLISFIVFLLSQISSTLASPMIGIGSMYDVFAPNSQSITKRVYNTGTSTAFVRVDILEINANNGTVNESAQKEREGNQLEQARLIVSPLRLIIPPEGFQAVRILWPGEREHERYFRVRFIPVLPEENDGFGMNKAAIKQYKEEALAIGVNVLTGYGSIVIVQPKTPKFNTRIHNESPLVNIQNQGNATVILNDIRDCKVAKTDCENRSREFILPGKSLVLNKKTTHEMHFTLIEGDKKTSLTY